MSHVTLALSIFCRGFAIKLSSLINGANALLYPAAAYIYWWFIIKKRGLNANRNGNPTPKGGVWKFISTPNKLHFQVNFQNTKIALNGMILDVFERRH